jgi:hypothetical protein
MMIAFPARIKAPALRYCRTIHLATQRASHPLACRPSLHLTYGGPIAHRITFPARTLSTTSNMTSFYDLKADLPGSNTYDFDQLKGKVVLIVNVASQW